MATWTQKQVVDLLPKYLSKRLAGHRPRAVTIASEAGVTPATLNLLYGAPRLGGDVITVARYRWRNPYGRKDPWSSAWDELTAAGLASRADGGWSITPRGTALVELLTREVRAHLESLSLPPLELRHATKTLVDLAAAIPATSERAQAGRRGLPLPDEVRSDVVRLEVAAGELWLQRDDCHIAAWTAAGYTGPELDVLSRVWEGKRSPGQLAEALADRQERGEVESALAALERRTDVRRESGDGILVTEHGRKRRDDIERATDRAYFAGWPTGDALARLGDDLTAVLAAIPA